MVVRINKASIKAKLDRAMEETEQEAKSKLKNIAFSLTIRVPVDTGAYAESFSVDTSGGRSIRRVPSSGRPRNQDMASYRNTAYSLMLSDIERIEILKSNRVQFKNGAPHATEVEARYQVFGAAKDKFR